MFGVLLIGNLVLLILAILWGWESKRYRDFVHGLPMDTERLQDLKTMWCT